MKQRKKFLRHVASAHGCAEKQLAVLQAATQKIAQMLFFARLLLLVVVSVFPFSLPVAAQSHADPLPSAEGDNADYRRLYDFLAGYLQNDLELQKLSLTAQSQRLSLKSTKIDNGTSFELSSGTVTLYSIGGKSYVDINPGASLSLPALNNTTVSASLPIQIDDGEKTLSGGTLSITTDILSGSSKTRRVTLLEAERAVLEAERDVKDRALNAETAFYTSLKTLYGYAVTVLEKKADLYDDDTALRKLVAQGYSESSSTYRQAALQVQSDKRDVEQAERRLERETAIFARKCGLTYERDESLADSAPDGAILNESELAYRSALAFLPFAIPEVEGVDVLSFDEKMYGEAESAGWDAYIGALKREADSDITLKATAEYTFNYDSSLSAGDESTQIHSDTVGGKLSLEWRGVSLAAGVALPTNSSVLGFNRYDVTSETIPIYTLSFGIVPNTFRTRAITKAQNQLDEQLEKIALSTASDDYETDVIDRQTTLSDLAWSRTSYHEEFDMYEKLEKDMAEWYRQGIITASDYYDSRDNRDMARLNLLINATEYIIYNNETKLLFARDDDATAAGTATAGTLGSTANAGTVGSAATAAANVKGEITK